MESFFWVGRVEEMAEEVLERDIPGNKGKKNYYKKKKAPLVPPRTLFFPGKGE